MNRTHLVSVKVGLSMVVTMALWLPIVAARAESHPDAWIIMKSKAVLELTQGARASAVSVDAVNGYVTLHGTVRSERDKANVAEDVRHVAGVNQVRNLLRVVASGNARRVRRSDETVRTDVQGALRADRSLDDSSIRVVSVSNGVVLLGGTAASSSDNVRALRSTADRAGVRQVFSEIEAQDAIDAPFGARNMEIPIEAMSSAPRDPVGVEDETIRRRVTEALRGLGVRDAANVHARVKDGVVWLTGSVPTWQGNSARMHAIRSVIGVRSIINDLRVVALNADRR